MEKFRKILQIIILGVILSVACVYGGDYLSARHRGGETGEGAAFETVKIEPTYAIPHKNGKDEFILGDPEYQTCIHSLFPHFGYSPCWYVKKNSRQMINL